MKIEESELEQWLSLEQAAVELGSTPLNLLMHIKRGLLEAIEQEDGWRVDRWSLAALRRRRAEEPAALVCRSACGKPTGGCGSCG